MQIHASAQPSRRINFHTIAVRYKSPQPSEMRAGGGISECLTKSTVSLLTTANDGSSSSMSETDTLLVQARAGDAQAFRNLVEPHWRSVFAIAFRILSDQQQAEDAVQNCFVRVHENLSSFNGRSSFKTWLQRIAVNCAIDLQRQQIRQQAAALDSGIEDEIVSGEAEPTRVVEGAEIGELTLLAMQDLTEMERTAFALRHHEGHSIADISKALDVSPSATKQAIFRAVRKLRVTLEPLVNDNDQSH